MSPPKGCPELQVWSTGYERRELNTREAHLIESVLMAMGLNAKLLLYVMQDKASKVFHTETAP